MSSGTNQLDEAAGEGEIKAGKEQLGEQGEGEEQQDREIRSLPWKSSTPERGPAAQENREPRRSGIQQAYESLDQLRRARVRLKVLKKETGEEVKRRKGVMPFSGTETVVERTDAERKLMERCQKEVERAREEFQSTLADAGGSSA